MQARHAQAEDATANTLPDLGNASERSGSLTPKPNGITLDNRFDGKRLVVSPEYSDQTGLSLGGIFAFPFGDSAAAGLVFTAGDRKNELLLNAGFQIDDAQRLILTLGQQRQHLDIGFLSGSEKAAMTQTSAAASYQFRLEQGSLNGAEINAYIADTPSRDLADKSYALDTATLYESWNDPRRVAGGRVTGLQARLAFTPMPGGIFKLGLGGEKQEYDYLAGKQSTTHGTGSAEWSQQLESGYQLNAGADAAVQNRYTLGLSRPFGDGWLFGINFVGIRSRDGAPDDNQIKLTWSYNFGGKRTTSGNGGSATPAWGSLLDQVARHPGFLPAQVVARLDTTAAPARLIAVDKTALPAGSSVNPATGAVSAPLGVAVTGILGVTLNGAPFANSGQFSLSGNSLSIDPNKITQPAVGVVDTYVVTLNNAGGGTTLVTVLVSHGSVKIDSITISNGDTTAPATTVAPAVSGTTDTATTLSVTISENGTGYYLVQAATAAAPSVAALQAGGTAFAITANVAATQNISGLAALTAYKIYFVAQDAANNMQAAVQSVAVTTTAAPDTIPPVAAADSATTPFNTAKTGIDVLANDTDNSGVAPSLTGVLTNPVGGSFAVNAGKIDFTPASGFSGAASVTYEIEDGGNNKAAGILTVTVEEDTPPPPPPPSDTTAPTTSAGPSVSGTTDTATTLSATLNENGTGYYLVQAFAAAAPNVAAVQAGTSFAMTANVAATPAIGGLTASTAYKIYFVAKDAANNVQAAVQSVDVTTSATPDTTAPTTSAGPSVSGTTDTATTLSATINENGTGYYLVQAFAAAAPSVAAVQAGTSFAMTANVAATPAIGGLTASTAYKIYFVAKDAANNVQAAVQSVAVTTTATPDTTPPVTSSAPAISVAATDTTASVTQTINENGTGYYLVLPAADAIPTVAAVKAGTSFAMTANTPAAVSLTGLTPSTAYKYYFVAKDAANNDQAAVSAGLALTTTATPDTTAPTTSAGPSVSGTTETGTTLSVTINENGTGYYLVQAFAAAAPNVAAVQAGTSFAMTANVAATPAIGGLTAATAYKIYFVAKDSTNNVQAAVGSVAVTTNTAPTANNFTYGTNIDNTAKTFDWKALSAAADADGDALTATVQAQGAKGTFVVAGDNVTYTPSANQTASDSGTLRISDGRGGVKDIVVTVNGIDTQAPAAPAGLVLDAGAASTTAASVALNNFTDPADADLAAWFVSESGSAPVAGDAGWSSTKPTTYAFATATNETKTVCVYVKDTLGNVQQTGACDTIDKVGFAPTASSVAITGTAQAGQTLTGSYTYADANGDPQGTSTFRWLRGGVAIAGATASTYTLVIADVGSAITFEVTPVATVSPTTGTPVVSAATAAVTLPAGYVSQGGLTWMPVTFANSWTFGDAYCSGTSILGQTGWRLPTTAELSALYASGAMNGQGWTLDVTWSSTSAGVGYRDGVRLNSGVVDWFDAADNIYVTCVR